ncbi:hypothetical protein HK102_010143, partial [Quaeritorhiza haematococci]
PVSLPGPQDRAVPVALGPGPAGPRRIGEDHPVVRDFHRHRRPQAGRGGPRLPGDDRRVHPGRDHRPGSAGVDHLLERGGRAAVRLHGLGGDRPAGFVPGPPGPGSGGGRRPRTGGPRRETRPVRIRASDQAGPLDPRRPDPGADQGARRSGRRLLHDRPRHRREEASRGRAPPAQPGPGAASGDADGGAGEGRGGGRGGESRQGRVPGQHEPRGADSHRGRHRLRQHAAAPDAADGGPRPRAAGHPAQRRPPQAGDRRHPRPVEDRGRQDGPGADRVRPLEGRARGGLAAGRPSARARRPDRAGRGGPPARLVPDGPDPRAAGAGEPGRQRGQAHRAGRPSPVEGLGRRARGGAVGPAAPGGGGHRDRDVARSPGGVAGHRGLRGPPRRFPHADPGGEGAAGGGQSGGPGHPLAFAPPHGAGGRGGGERPDRARRGPDPPFRPRFDGHADARARRLRRRQCAPAFRVPRPDRRPHGPRDGRGPRPMPAGRLRRLRRQARLARDPDRHPEEAPGRQAAWDRTDRRRGGLLQRRPGPGRARPRVRGGPAGA